MDQSAACMETLARYRALLTKGLGSTKAPAGPSWSFTTLINPTSSPHPPLDLLYPVAMVNSNAMQWSSPVQRAPALKSLSISFISLRPCGGSAYALSLQIRCECLTVLSTETGQMFGLWKASLASLCRKCFPRSTRLEILQACLASSFLHWYLLLAWSW